MPQIKLCFWWFQHQWSKWSQYGTAGAYIYCKRECSICGRIETRSF